MLYKPNYCCNCGDKIERINWNVLTSRRFCEVCETENQLDKLLKIIFPTVLLLFGVFGISGYFYTPENAVSVSKTETRPVTPNVEKDKVAEIRSLKSETDSGTKRSRKDRADSIDQTYQKNPKLLQEQSVAPVNNASEEVANAKSPQKTAKETVYFCGAETKKGTPCSRKVKGGGRCWQHEGRDAMLPAKELRIAN